MRQQLGLPRSFVSAAVFAVDIVQIEALPGSRQRTAPLPV
jgi:hypothetical protein